MAKNKKIIEKPNKERVNLSEDYEVQYWSTKFTTTKEKLKKAIKEVGDNAKDVEEYFKK